MENGEVNNRPKVIIKRNVKKKNVISDDNKVGILKEPLDLLASIQLNNDHPQLCTLIIHEQILIQKKEKFNGKIWGYNEGLIKNSEALSKKKLAKKAIILMVVSLEENWKIPIGLFFVGTYWATYVSNLSNTIKETLTQLKTIGIQVVCISMNCLSDFQLTLVTQLGGEINVSSPTSSVNTSFNHPHCGIVSIYFHLSPLIDDCKCYWLRYKKLCHKYDMIHYELVIYAKRLKIDDFPKCTSEILDDWTVIQKRLNYDEEIISKTTANALKYLIDINHPDFKTAQPTITFIKVFEFIRSLVDISRIDQKEAYAMNPDYEDHWKPWFVKCNYYLKHLKELTVDEHIDFNLCIIGIRASLLSLLDIYTNHISTTSKSKNANPRIPLTSRLDSNNVSVMISNKVPTALTIYKEITSLAKKTHLIMENEAD